MSTDNRKEFEKKQVNADDSLPSNNDITVTMMIFGAIAVVFVIAVGFYLITNPDWIDTLIVKQ